MQEALGKGADNYDSENQYKDLIILKNAKRNLIRIISRVKQLTGHCGLSEAPAT